MKLKKIVLGCLLLTESIVAGNESVNKGEYMPSTKGLEIRMDFNVNCSTGKKINLKYYTPKFKTKKEYIFSATREGKDNPYLIIIDDKIYLDNKNEDGFVDEEKNSKNYLETEACKYIKSD